MVIFVLVVVLGLVTQSLNLPGIVEPKGALAVNTAWNPPEGAAIKTALVALTAPLKTTKFAGLLAVPCASAEKLAVCGVRQMVEPGAKRISVMLLEPANVGTALIRPMSSAPTSAASLR